MHQNPIRDPSAVPALARLLAPVLALCLALPGCQRFAESNYNPLSWFRASADTAPVVLYLPPEDDRPLVAQVLTLKIEQTPDGAIVRATGLTPTQGWWKAALVKVEQGDAGTLVYAFRLFPPLTPNPASLPRSREVTVAVALSNRQLDGIGTITVQGQGNALSARR